MLPNQDNIVSNFVQKAFEILKVHQLQNRSPNTVTSFNGCTMGESS